jgi:predicted O-methyltransferase YrrM
MINELDYFDKYQQYLQGRYWTMRSALNILHQRGGSTIVETGCMRGFQDWGAGMSTYVLGEYVSKFGGHVYSVDIDPHNVAIAKHATQEMPVTVIEGDSIEYLTNFDKPIDLLYLDSYDMGDSAEQAKAAENHQLKEIDAAWEKLSANAIILLDDCNFIQGGKTGLTRSFLDAQGCTEIFKFQQSLWIK